MSGPCPRARALGNGIPIGAMCTTAALAEALTPGTHASTFGGNPLAAACAVAVIDELVEGGVLAHGREVGDYLARRGEPREAPLYCQWIRMYVSEEYTSLAKWARSLANRIADEAGAAEVTRMEESYLTSLKYEYMFWYMAYNLEAWPV